MLDEKQFVAFLKSGLGRSIGRAQQREGRDSLSDVRRPSAGERIGLL